MEEVVEELNANQGGCTINENTDVVGLKRLLEEANLARQKHAEERDQLIVRVETLQRQLVEVIEAKVGLEKEKKLLLAGGTADASQCSTPGASQGNCSTPPQPNLKRMSRAFTSAQLEDWEKLQLRMQKAERALEHERMVTSELQRQLDRHRAAALFGKTAQASYDQLVGELAAAQQECAQQQQQADALRAAMVASDHAAAQLQQELAEFTQNKQVSSREEDSVKEKLREAEKAADQQCVELAALVDQLVQENLDLGARLNAKSAALTKARHEASQMQAKMALLEAAAAPGHGSASRNLTPDPHDPSTHTAITIGDSGTGTGLRALESGLPGGLSDTQWQLLMLSEEVARLTQQLADLQGPLTKLPAYQGQAHALSVRRNCNDRETASAIDIHGRVQPPTSACTSDGVAPELAIEESGGGRGEGSGWGPSVECGCATSLQGLDQKEGAADEHLVSVEDGASGDGSARAGLPPVDVDLGPRNPRQPLMKHAVVELHLPPTQLQQRVSELAATMMELEEQVEAELAKRKRREQLQEEQHSQVSTTKDAEGVSTSVAIHQSDSPAPGNSREPGLQQPHDQQRAPDTQQEQQQQQQQQQHQPLQQPQHQTHHSQPALCLHPPSSSSREQQPAQPLPSHLQQHHHHQQHQQQQSQFQGQPALSAHPSLQQHHHEHHQQHQQQQSQFQGQPALPAHPHLPVPSNLWERRLSRSLSMASLSGQSSGSPAPDCSANSHAVHVLLPPNGLSVEVGDGGGELDPADPPFVQQIDHIRQPRYSNEDGLLLSDDEDDDEEMLKKGRGAKHAGSSHSRKGGWGLWSWLAGGG